MLYVLLYTWLKIIIPAGIRMFFSRKKLNLVCVGTTTSFGPGRLHKTQYAWLLTVLCRDKITEGGLFMTPWEFFSIRTLVRSWTNFYTCFFLYVLRCHTCYDIFDTEHHLLYTWSGLSYEESSRPPYWLGAFFLALCVCCKGCMNNTLDRNQAS